MAKEETKESRNHKGDSFEGRASMSKRPPWHYWGMVVAILEKITRWLMRKYEYYTP
jgi:hypothetical protein